MDNKTYIGQEFRKGNKVYIIDDYDERAMCYDPARPGRVTVKAPHGPKVDCDATSELIFESTLSGRIVSEEDFLDY